MTPGFWLGSEVLVDQPEGDSYRKRLRNARVGILAHPASVDFLLRPVWDRIGQLPGVRITALFGPQHGFQGEKQDNMVESADSILESKGIPVFSLYGTTRRLRNEWTEHFDVLLVDVQDVGVRVYTFLTTIAYLLEDLAGRRDKEIWILDRPNPVGRIVEGHRLESGWESFVGVAEIPMQHGFTVGEFAHWYAKSRSLDTRLEVIHMSRWETSQGWPRDRVWIQPSPNMPGLHTTRTYPGTVMLEGTTISEARGTTRPLSMFGHPDIDWQGVYRWLTINAADALEGAAIRSAVFEPTFHKHAGKACPGFEIIAEGRFYDPVKFTPYRLIAYVLKAIRAVHPGFSLWTDPPYEYEYIRSPIDVITGSDKLRNWVDDDSQTPVELERTLSGDEASWRDEIQQFFYYSNEGAGEAGS